MGSQRRFDVLISAEFGIKKRRKDINNSVHVSFILTRSTSCTCMYIIIVPKVYLALSILLRAIFNKLMVHSPLTANIFFARGGLF